VASAGAQMCHVSCSCRDQIAGPTPFPGRVPVRWPWSPLRNAVVGGIALRRAAHGKKAFVVGTTGVWSSQVANQNMETGGNCSRGKFLPAGLFHPTKPQKQDGVVSEYWKPLAGRELPGGFCERVAKRVPCGVKLRYGSRETSACGIPSRWRSSRVPLRMRANSRSAILSPVGTPSMYFCRSDRRSPSCPCSGELQLVAVTVGMSFVNLLPIGL